jgi:DNA-directed RNA polymerase specialized sigma24 family protein
MQRFTNDELFQGILGNNKEILDYLYKEVYRQVRWLVIHNHGNEQDAKDTFQDAIVILSRKLKKDKLVLHCTLATYIYAICRFLWLKELSRRQRSEEFIETDYFCFEMEGESELELLKKEIYLKHFSELSIDCQKILHLHMNCATISEITSELGYRDNQYTMEKKYRCKQRLIEKIIKNPLFRKIKDEL